MKDEESTTIPSPPSLPSLPIEKALTLEAAVQRIERKIAESEARTEKLVENQTIALLDVIEERFNNLAQGLVLERKIRQRGVRAALAAARANGANGKSNGETEKSDGDSGQPDADS